MWANLVIFPFPIIHHNPAFGESIEYFRPQAFSPEPVVESFDIPVLPWTTRINVERFDTLFLEPLSQWTTDKLWTIVRSDGVRCSIFVDHFFHECLNRLGTYMSGHMETMGLNRELFIH